MKTLLFATLFASLIVFSVCYFFRGCSNIFSSTQLKKMVYSLFFIPDTALEYFYGENADASVAFEFDERDTNTTGFLFLKRLKTNWHRSRYPCE